jgi:hypothetical protein
MEKDAGNEEDVLLVKVSQKNLGQGRDFRAFSENQGDLS